MTDDQIKHMVDRFLSWRLPQPWSPDGGISFEPVGNKGTPHEYRREPTGTNLFDAEQATAMVRYMVEDMPGDRLHRLKQRLDARLNNHLCDMRGGYDDSIVGFNEAWDIVRAIFAEELSE